MDNVIHVDFGMELPIDETSSKLSIENVRINYAEEVSDEALEAVVQIFRNYGYLTREEKINQKDIIAISELFKSTLLRYSNIEYPMQKVIDEAIQIEYISDIEEQEQD